MTRFIDGLKAMLLGMVALVLVACDSVPSNGASPPDANNQDAAVVDRPAPTPDATVAPDNPTPPPSDVPATPDAPPPSPDATVEPDASVPPDMPPPPPDATVMTGFDESICNALNRGIWGVEGMSGTGTIVCMMQPDGNHALLWIDTLAGILGIGYTDGECDNMTCGFPLPARSDGCVLMNMNPTMQRFNAFCNGRNFTIILSRPR